MCILKTGKTRNTPSKHNNEAKVKKRIKMKVNQIERERKKKTK